MSTLTATVIGRIDLIIARIPRRRLPAMTCRMCNRDGTRPGIR